MKQVVCLVCAAGLIVSSFAQTSSLQIAMDKTTSLIFPYPVKHVDRGTKDVLVEPVKEAANILLVKAASRDFAATNLSIITDDGSVYSIDVSYGEPSVWVYKFPVQLKTSLSTYALNILDNPSTKQGPRNESGGVIGTLAGIYTRDDVIYYQLQLNNRSAIDYDIDFLRFYVRDKKKAKRTAMQEIELSQLYRAGNTARVRANSSNSIVVALGKMTLPDDKYLVIEIGEMNGGRNLYLHVKNRRIIKAIQLPDIR